MTDVMAIPTNASNLATLAQKINGAHARVVGSFRESVEHARRAGELLEQAHRALRRARGHGHWQKWLTTNCPNISIRTAHLYVRIFRKMKILEREPKKLEELAGLSLRRVAEATRERSPSTRTDSLLDRPKKPEQDHIKATAAQSWPRLAQERTAAARQSVRDAVLAHLLAKEIGRHAHVPPGADTGDIVTQDRLARLITIADQVADACAARIQNAEDPESS